jgi:hypothetical protein
MWYIYEHILCFTVEYLNKHLYPKSTFSKLETIEMTLINDYQKQRYCSLIPLISDLNCEKIS